RARRAGRAQPRRADLRPRDRVRAGPRGGRPPRRRAGVHRAHRRTPSVGRCRERRAALPAQPLFRDQDGRPGAGRGSMSAKVVSCGVVMLNERREIFVCHATGTARWDLPKGLQDPGETALQTAVRETWEETSLALDAATLTDLGLHPYLPAKDLHLYALRVE